MAMPADSHYARARENLPKEALAEQPSAPEEHAAERAMREAEIAVVQHTATPTSAVGSRPWRGC